MANIQSAKKRSRQANSRNSLKSSQRASMRTMIRNVEDAIKENDATKAKDLFISTQKVLDKLANKKVLPKNAVARQKSRLTKSIKKLGSESRKDLEDFFNRKVFLELNVKVYKDWRKNSNHLKKLGYN